MNRSVMKFFQAGIWLVGIIAVVFLLWEPHLEGWNAHATLWEIYFQDLFLAYAYLASVPFFVVLYQAFLVLRYAGEGKFSSRETAGALRTIKRSALALIAFALGGEVWIMSIESDDRAGGVFMGLLVILGSIAIFAIASILNRAIQLGSETSK